MNNYRFDWSDIAFGNKKAIHRLKATFIAAPRELSVARFTQLVKAYLPKGNIVLGIAKEDYIAGFDGQPQFCTLKADTVQPIIDKVNRSESPHKLYILDYFQRELPYVLEKLNFRQAVLVNGSWHHAFHTLPSYYTLVNRRIPYQLVSPFIDETEARTYEGVIDQQNPIYQEKKKWYDRSFNEVEMMDLATQASRLSYDYTFQTGVALGTKAARRYRLLNATFNRVVPFQTYAMHYGALRERHFSPPHDVNYYDTVHAEMELLVRAQKERIDLKHTTMFINLLPCPACARTLSTTDIAEFVYQADHSDGYAAKLLEQSGKRVRRLVV